MAGWIAAASVPAFAYGWFASLDQQPMMVAPWTIGFLLAFPAAAIAALCVWLFWIARDQLRKRRETALRP